MKSISSLSLFKSFRFIAATPFTLQHEDLLADPPSGGQLVPGRSPLHPGDGQDHKTLIKQISNGAYRQPPKPSGE